MYVDTVNGAADTAFNLFTMSHSVDLMCIVCTSQERLRMRTINHKIVRLWAEQGELVHACIVGMLFTLVLG